MKHLKKSQKFGRKSDPRRAMIRSLAENLFLRGKIITTEAKAKALRPFVEKIITRAKTKTLSNQRQILRLFSEDLQKKIFDEYGKKYQSRPGGYTKILKVGTRKSSAAAMAIIQFV